MNGALDRVANGVDTVCGWIDKAVQWCLIFFLAAIYVLMMAQVLLRYVIFSPVIWIEEVAAYLLPLLAIWGAATCFRQNNHLSVSFLLDMMPDLLRRIVLVAIYALVFYFAWKITTSGLALAELGRNERATSGAFSLYWPRILIVVGGILVMIQIANLVLLETLGRGPRQPRH
jgi:TRAP-type transport system small permease protein